MVARRLLRIAYNSTDSIAPFPGRHLGPHDLPDETGQGLPLGAWIGIGVAIFVFVIAVISFIVWYCYCRQPVTGSDGHSGSTSPVISAPTQPRVAEPREMVTRSSASGYGSPGLESPD